ncbi:MAG: 4'-phosphopantetheinyl transferase superfamily protein [Niabella sp.]
MLKIFCSDINNITWQSRGLLLSNEAHVYLFDISETDLLAETHLVTRDEQSKASFFRQDMDAKRFLAGRVFTKKILSGILGIEPAHILIRAGKNGKPFAQYNGIELQSLRFNISHSGNLVMIGICGEDIGVDIEEMKPDPIVGLPATVFSKSELEVFENSSNPLKTFYTFWTRKEAILKATGEGLTDNLQGLEVLDGTNENNLFQNTGQFIIISFEPAAKYRASVCVSSHIQVRFYHFGWGE